MIGLPSVSVIIPCCNEEKFIGKCLDSVLANEYPVDWIEILVVDGMSHDGTWGIAEAYAKQYPVIRLLENGSKITPCALNIGIKNARCEIILRMDAHSSYKKDYISECVKYLIEYGADNVGGVWKILPRQNTLAGKAIVLALSHPFGIGNAYYRFASNKKPIWVDTVPFFCCRRELFEKVGLFNESLVRGQDQEFNLRLRKAGGRTLLVPDIVSYYYARSDVKSFCKHNWSNGLWAILPFLYCETMPVSWRHLVPVAFVTSLLVVILLGLLAKPFFWLFLVIIGSYILASLIASFQIAWRERDIRYLIVTPFIFGMLHIGYGLGSLWGVFKLLGAPKFWNKLLRLVW